MAKARRKGQKQQDTAVFRDLVPLNSLSDEHFAEISRNIVVEDVSAGRYLFGEGDEDNRSIYLLDGEVNFVDGNGRVSGMVIAGTDPARYPLANHQPRLVSARVAVRSIIATIDSNLLDVLLTFEQSSAAKPAGAGAQQNDDWLTRMFQSDAFIKLAPGDIQRMLKKLESVHVNEGDVVIRQGDEGDYFYVIREGSCSVTRAATRDGWQVPLAELSDGDCFGEEALVSDAPRNATVTMLTRGTLMRLSKEDFLELLKKPMVHYIDYEMARSMVEDGDLWLDVRLPDEYANEAFEDSINIPLLSLRDKVSRLLPNRKYIICCDTGRRSASAAFLLSQRGYEVYVLEGGLTRGVPPGVFGMTVAAPEPAAANEPAATPGPAPALAAVNGPAHEALQREHASARLQHEELQDALQGLMTRFTLYMKQAERLEEACDDARRARKELEGELQALKSRFSRPLTLK